MSLILENVDKRFVSRRNNIQVLHKINLNIAKGEFVCVVGPSGCGKSTMLNLIAGLEKPSSGSVLINGRKVSMPGSDRAFIFQESALFPWLNVIDNVEFGMKMAGVKKRERREKALKYLKMVHLTKFRECYLHELSGGMKQRVALARALTLDSEVLLMDEPFAALDSQMRDILQQQLQQIWMETGKTILFVTHSIEEAVYLGDRVIVMSALPGMIKKEITIDLHRPRKTGSPEFVNLVTHVMCELKGEVTKVAKDEYDADWDFKEDGILPDIDSRMGVEL